MQAGKKEKKITVKFFLNHLVEPVTGEKRQKYYPLYIQITYNRKNMQFRSKYGLYYRNLKEVKPELMSFEEKVLAKIIRQETKGKDDYDLKGLKRKYELYSTSLSQSLEEYLKPRLRTAILKTGSELSSVINFEQPQVKTALIYEAACLLFPNFTNLLTQKLKDDLEAYAYYHQLNKEPVLSFNFPTLIDWIEGSYKADFTQLLNKKYKEHPEIIKKVTAVIDQAVKESLHDLNA